MVKDGGKHGAEVDPGETRQGSSVPVNRQDHTLSFLLQFNYASN